MYIHDVVIEALQLHIPVCMCKSMAVCTMNLNFCGNRLHAINREPYCVMSHDCSSIACGLYHLVYHNVV